MAKALKVRNFKLLVNELGEERLGVLLDASVQRIKELTEGLNFTEEFAYHVETTLDLPSGFLDQVNPVLTEEERTRLKTLEQPSHEDHQEESRAVSAAPKEQPPVLNDDTKESTMATATAEAGRKTAHAPDEAKLREIRRANFALLTDRPGAKTQVSRVSGLSAANISHRLHGNKHFDAATGEFFCERLGLPAGWFNSPRKEADIPQEVLQLLASDNPAAPRKVSTRRKAAGKQAGEVTAKTPARRGRKPKSDQAGSQTAGVVPSSLAPTRGAKRAPAPAAAPLRLTATGAAGAASAPAPVTPRTAATAAQGSAAAQAIQLVGGNISPVAEALLRTLATKARDGKLSEEAALKMLVEAATL